MHSRKLGSFNVSALGLGCMNIAMGYGPIPEEPYSLRLLYDSLECGYNFLDTAAMYGMGRSEQMIGKVLAHRRPEFTLASNCGIYKIAAGETETRGGPEVLQQSGEDGVPGVDWGGRARG